VKQKQTELEEEAVLFPSYKTGYLSRTQKPSNNIWHITVLKYQRIGITKSFIPYLTDTISVCRICKWDTACQTSMFWRFSVTNFDIATCPYVKNRNRLTASLNYHSMKN